MIDVSDGLATDIRHLAGASGVGVQLAEVPVAPGAQLDEAIGGGEDYELLFAAPDAGAVVAQFEAAGLRQPIEIGVCLEGPVVVKLGRDELAGSGYEHSITW